VLAGTSSQEMQDYVGAKFYCLHALADGNQRIRITEKTLEFFSAVLSTLSPYLVHIAVQLSSNIHTLPERQEDDGLDGKKLKYWIVRPQKVFSGEVEQKQSIQR